MKKPACLLLGCLAALAGGCGPSSLYSVDGRRAPAAAVSERAKWSASGDLVNVALAIDGDPATYAFSPAISSGASITVDLGKPCLFNMVVIEHGPKEKGFCRRVALLTSLDGKNFEHQWTAPGTRGLTTLNMMSPVLARYVRLQVVLPGDQPWSVAELYIQ